MRFLHKVACFVFIVSVFAPRLVNAQETMAILTDNLKPVSTNYIIYPETSNLVAQDLSNLINVNNRVKALPVCNSIGNAQKKAISNEVIQLVKEYQYTYNVNYEILRRISEKLGTPYILLISSGMDIETDFLKETIWSKLSISGESSINPHYKLVTRITLIDPHQELILLEKSYIKSMPSSNMDLANPRFSPSLAQLSKVKQYSETLAREITPGIEAAIVPGYVPEKQTRVDKIMFRYGYVKNKSPIKDNTVFFGEEPIQHSKLEIKTNPKVKLYNYVEEDL